MKKERHLEKAKRIEASIKNLDEEEDWELIVEGVYGAALNYIAYICEIKIGRHKDIHKGLPRFLDENNLIDLAGWFRVLDTLRQGHWYGSRTNGETSALAKRILNQIKGVAYERRG
ncbi:MAG: hypothetical protein ACE5KE_09425 [Methanosarcinales archaeon]